MTEHADKLLKGVYGFKVENGKVTPPKYEFPQAMKDRIIHFQQEFENGLTLMGALEAIFAYDEEAARKEFETWSALDWLPMDPEAKAWIDESMSFGQWVVATAIMYNAPTNE